MGNGILNVDEEKIVEEYFIKYSVKLPKNDSESEMNDVETANNSSESAFSNFPATNISLLSEFCDDVDEINHWNETLRGTIRSIFREVRSNYFISISRY